MLLCFLSILESNDAGGFNGGGPNCQASEPVALLKEHPAWRQNRRDPKQKCEENEGYLNQSQHVLTHQ